MPPRTDPVSRASGGLAVALSFRSRLTVALLIAALLPLTVFAVLVLVIEALLLAETADGLQEIILFTGLLVALAAVPLTFLLAVELLRPLRAVARFADRVSAGQAAMPVAVPGDDELARLADSHARLAADVRRRSAQVERILEAIARMSPRDGVESLSRQAASDAARAFDLIDATVDLGGASDIEEPEVIPGETRPLRAALRVGDEHLGMLLGSLAATRTWARPDQDLFELFASEVAVALRNAELFARVEAQNARLLELDAAKDEFLRGVSHNLQSPLTSVTAYAEQLARERPDRRLEIIAEQSQRLSRMVRQLLTVSRLESGAIKPRSEVISLGSRTRRAWEALGVSDVPFGIEDHSGGWLTIADTDQLDQVLWALLENAVKYGQRSPIEVRIAAEPETSRLKLTVADAGPGVSPDDAARLFQRFSRGAQTGADGGSGLGLYVSRELCRAMGGDLVLEPADSAGGAAFTVYLPGERAEEP